MHLEPDHPFIFYKTIVAGFKRRKLQFSDFYKPARDPGKEPMPNAAFSYEKGVLKAAIILLHKEGKMETVCFAYFNNGVLAKCITYTYKAWKRRKNKSIFDT